MNEEDSANHFTYRYFILGGVTPVRLKYNAANHVTGAQIPDASEPGGFRWSGDHLGRIYESDEVDEVDQGTFEETVRTYLAVQAEKNRKTGEPG